MSQSEVYAKAGKENKKTKLNKPIYELKTGATSGHIKLGESLTKCGFVQNKMNKCVYKNRKKLQINLTL